MSKTVTNGERKEKDKDAENVAGARKRKADGELMVEDEKGARGAHKAQAAPGARKPALKRKKTAAAESDTYSLLPTALPNPMEPSVWCEYLQYVALRQILSPRDFDAKMVVRANDLATTDDQRRSIKRRQDARLGMQHLVSTLIAKLTADESPLFAYAACSIELPVGSVPPPFAPAYSFFRSRPLAAALATISCALCPMSMPFSGATSTASRKTATCTWPPWARPWTSLSSG